MPELSPGAIDRAIRAARLTLEAAPRTASGRPRATCKRHPSRGFRPLQSGSSRPVPHLTKERHVPPTRDLGRRGPDSIPSASEAWRTKAETLETQLAEIRKLLLTNKSQIPHDLLQKILTLTEAREPQC